MAENTETTVDLRKRRGRRMALITLGVIALLGAMAFFLPAILSLARVRRYIVAKVNDRMDGRVAVEDWKLTWNEGLSFDGVTFVTDDESVTVSTIRLSTSGGLLRFIGASNNLGRVRLVAPELVVRLGADKAGSSSVTGEVAGVEGELPGETPPRVPAAEAEQEPRPSRDIAADISLAQGTVRIEHPDGHRLVLTNVTATTQINGFGRPIRFECEGEQGGDSGRIVMRGALQVPFRGQTAAPGLRGSVDLDVTQFEMAALSAITSCFEPFPQMSGSLNSTNRVELEGPGRIALVSRTEITGFRASGGALGEDKPSCDRIVLDCDAGLTNGVVALRKLVLESPFGEASLRGRVRPPAEGAALQADLTAEVTAELTELGAQLPRTLRLRPGLAVTDGRASLRGRLELNAEETVFDANMTTTPIRALRDSKPIAIDAPMQVRAEGKIDARGIDLKTLKVETPFARVSGQGTVTNLAIDLSADLASAQREAAKFMELGNRKFAGTLKSVIRMRRVSERESALSVIGAIEDLRVDGVAPKPLTQARVRSVLNARMVLDEGGTVQRFEGVRFRCEADELMADATAGRVEWATRARPFSLREGTCSITGDVARVAAKAQETGLLEADPKRRTSGRLAVTGRFSIVSNVVDVGEASATVTSLIYDNGTAGMHEPEVRLSASGVLGPETWTIRSVGISSRPLSLSGRGRVTDLSSACLLELEGTARTDLNRVGEILSAFAGTGIEVAGSKDGPFRYRGPLRAGSGLDALRRADAEARLYVQRLSWKGAAVKECEPVIRLAGGELVAEVKTSLNDGQLHVVPLVDFNKTPPMLQIPDDSSVVVNAKLDEALASELLAHVHPVLKGSAILGGRVGVDMAYLRLPLGSNAQSSAEFEGELVLTNVVLRPAALLGDILDLCRARSTEAVVPYQRIKFTCREGRMACAPLRIETSKATVVVSGSVGLDGTLAYLAELPVGEGMVSGRYVKFLKDVTLRVPVGGTIEHPRIDRDALTRELAKLTGRVMENYLKEEGTKHLEDRLKKEGADLLKKLFE